MCARIADGSRDAFATLYDRHSRAVYRYAFGIVRDADLAQDVTQEAFLTTWVRAPHIRIVGESALPWLLVCTRNHANNSRRRESTRATTVLDDARLHSGDDTSATVILADELAWVSAELALLSDLDRRLVDLCLDGDLSYDAAARQLGISTNAVAKRIQRIRTRLRERREPQGQSDSPPATTGRRAP